jgi:hypothetical protein
MGGGAPRSSCLGGEPCSSPGRYRSSLRWLCLGLIPAYLQHHLYFTSKLGLGIHPPDSDLLARRHSPLAVVSNLAPP